MKRRVPGAIHHTARHNKRLYLFPSDKEKQAFLADPTHFAGVDLALNGNCAVCQAMMGKQVPGEPEFTAVYNGLRYQFPSDRERQAFLAAPQRFAEKQDSSVGSAARPASVQGRRVRVEGRSGCAACEHGVTPIGATDTLGLAVNTSDGRVYVIEDAHRLYPKVYKDRFSGLKLSVSGEIIRRGGKVAWLRPSSLAVIN